MATSHSDIRIGPRRKQSSRTVRDISRLRVGPPAYPDLGAKPFFTGQKKRWATDQDIKFLVRRLAFHDDIEKSAGYLGFKLSKTKLEILRKKLQAKSKREENRMKRKANKERERLEKLFQAAINEIVPACKGFGCINRDIRAKISTTYHEAVVPLFPGSIGRDSYIEYFIEFLFCTECGLVYYNDEVKKLSERYKRGEFKPKTLIARPLNTFPFG